MSTVLGWGICLIALLYITFIWLIFVFIHAQFDLSSTKGFKVFLFLSVFVIMWVWTKLIQFAPFTVIVG